MRANRRPRTRVLSALAAIAALLAPALALATDGGDRPREAFAVESLFPLKQESRPKKAERRERPEPRGPFHPLDGASDYGTAENAFGASRSDHVHAGQDVFAPTGTPLVAVSDGVVAEAGSDGGQGNYVHLYDPKRDRTYVYMHMVQPAAVKTGEDVTGGDVLGGVGCTGSCWGDHLHFEVRAGKGIAGDPQDPLPLLERWERVR